VPASSTNTTATGPALAPARQDQRAVVVGSRADRFDPGTTQRSAEAGPLLVGAEPREHRIEERLVRQARLVAQRDVLQASVKSAMSCTGVVRTPSRRRWCASTPVTK
jgi:hypothetical protein